jgi:hypothetical protein
VGAILSGNADRAATADDDVKFKSPAIIPVGSGLRKEADDVLWQKLHAHGCPKFVKA